MPQLQANNIQLHYEEFGSGDETIVFSHGYLMNHEMFAAQIEVLQARYRIIAYDHRCHGGSEIVKQPFGIYDLVDDAAALIDQLVDGPVHFMGMSTGGYVGTRLMIKRPELLHSVVLMDTSAESETADQLRQYNLMLTLVRLFGVRIVFGRAITILMGEKFRNDPARQEEYDKWQRYIRTLDKTGLYYFGRAIFDRDAVRQQISGMTLPALVIVGEEDVPTPPSKAQLLADALPNARLVLVPNAGHTSPVEEPAAVNTAIESFLSDL